jgi:hypothetical protein
MSLPAGEKPEGTYGNQAEMAWLLFEPNMLSALV